MNDKLKTAFTLIELLVVLAIVGILSGLIIVGMNSSLNSARVAKSQVFSTSLRNLLLMNLVSEWKLDGDTNDSWSGGNNGTWHGAAGGSNITANYRPASECVYGQCLNFDGTDDYVSIASLPNQSIHGPSTIELWFNPFSASSGRIFSDHCIEWGFNLSGGDVYGGAYGLMDGGAVSLNAWHHVAVLHEHPTGLTNTKIYFYVDGIKKGESTLTIVAQNGYYDPPYYFGDDACTAGTFFTGNIDNVRYYKYAVALSLIKERYYAGLNRLLENKNISKEEYLNRIGSLSNNKLAKNKQWIND